MPLSLQASIQSLAAQFAQGVLTAVRGASLEEILGESASRRGRGRPPGKRGPGRPHGSQTRLARRSEGDLKKLAESIVALVGKHKKGVRGEVIRSQLGLARNEWTRPLAFALASKKIRKTGAKRATTYFSS
jgi:hypothetical protein